MSVDTGPDPNLVDRLTALLLDGCIIQTTVAKSQATRMIEKMHNFGIEMYALSNWPKHTIVRKGNYPEDHPLVTQYYETAKKDKP